MRRVALTIVATITGLVLLLQFKVHSTDPTTGALATVNSTPPSAHARHPSRTVKKRHPVTRPSSAAASPVTRTITGQTAQTRYGPVQVQIVETGGRLTDVKALQLPNGDPHSAEIAANAVPVLRGEALRANSAHIDVVSGATYTSDGYAQSLQSALDNA